MIKIGFKYTRGFQCVCGISKYIINTRRFTTSLKLVAIDIRRLKPFTKTVSSSSVAKLPSKSILKSPVR